MRGHIANTLQDVGEKNKLYNDGRDALFLQVASKRAVFLRFFIESRATAGGPGDRKGRPYISSIILPGL